MRIAKILLIMIAGVLIIGGCSAPSSSSVCPDMGTITSIDSPESPLNVDSLIGSNAPDFTWDIVDCASLEVQSQNATLSQYQGKPVMLVFHKSMNCPGCKAEMPFILGAYENWKDKGLIILTIYRKDDAGKAKGFVQSNQLELYTLADPHDLVASKLGFAQGAPISVFIDKSGIIKQYLVGAFSSQADIENILASLE